MAKALQGAAEIAGGIALEFVPGAQFFATQLLAYGIATEAGAIASALGSKDGISTTTRQAAALRQIIYGEQRVAGTIVYCSTTGSTHNQYNLVIVLATHPCEAIVNLYLDGRQVYWDTSSAYNQTVNGVNFGGNPDGNTHIGPNGIHYNFGGKLFCAAFQGNQTDAPTIIDGAWVGPSTINGNSPSSYPGYCSALYANDPTWAPTSQGTPYLAGCTYVYLKLEYDPGTFPQFPEIRFTVMGKNNIYDPRTETTGFSTNWALIVADMITDSQWGLGDNSVNQDQLIAAANVCDEQVATAAGITSWEPDTQYNVSQVYSEDGTIYTVTSNYISGATFGATDLANTEVTPDAVVTEAQYTLSWHYDTSMSPGDAILQTMDAAAGRLSRIGGEWFIWPAYWQGPSFTFDENSLVDTLQWTAKRPLDQLFNRVTGTFVAPNYPYNVAGDLYDSNAYYEGETQNNFPFAFQPTSYPQFACDQLHGFGTGVDVYLQQDGGIYLPKEIQQPCILSIAQAQRVASIHLLRNRQQGTGILPMNLSGYQLQPTDVLYFNLPSLSWTNKQLEVIGTKLKMVKAQNSDYAGWMVEVSVCETDPSVYEWDYSTEELSPYDVPVISGGVEQYIVQPPTGLTAQSNISTALVQPDGTVIPRIELTWTEPTDLYVTNGGFILIQMCAHGSGAWQTVLTVDGQTTTVFLGNVVSGQSYDVRIAAQRSSGAQSAWEELDGIAVGMVVAVTGLVTVAPAGTLMSQATGSTAQISVSNFTATFGAASVACTPSPNTISGLNQGQLYYVYYQDPNFAGGSITPVATQNVYDFLNKVGYYLIGWLTTAASTPVFRPSAYIDLGTTATINPTYAYDGNPLDVSAVNGGGDCQWLDFPNYTTTAAKTLTVYAGVNCIGSGSTAQLTVTIAGGSPTTLVTSTDPATMTPYTLSVPSGTNLNTVVLEATAVYGTGSLVAALIQISDINIQ